MPRYFPSKSQNIYASCLFTDNVYRYGANVTVLLFSNLSVYQEWLAKSHSSIKIHSFISVITHK